jgi:hypothetical protein
LPIFEANGTGNFWQRFSLNLRNYTQVQKLERFKISDIREEVSVTLAVLLNETYT